MRWAQFFYGALLGSFFWTGDILADELAPFSAGPAPSQEYHSVNAVGAPQPVAIAPVAQAAAPDRDPPIVENTQKEIIDLTQHTLRFEQQTNQQLQDLRDSNHTIGIMLQNMTQQIEQLQRQSGHVSQAVPMETKLSHAFRDPETQGALLGSTTVIFMTLGLFLARRLYTRAQPAPVKVGASGKNEDQNESEYDFMGTTEAIPAKLDLARSYIAMQDFEQARGILKTIFEKGNEAQRHEAQQLLQRLVS